jgi:D-aminoacyl-tRNA deacylase
MQNTLKTETLIIASNKDLASLNIAQTIIRRHGFIPLPPQAPDFDFYKGKDSILLVGAKECIYVEPEDIPVESERVIFVSKHKSAQDLPALTVHATGNLTAQAKFGGKPEEVSWVDPRVLKRALVSMRQGLSEAGLRLEVTMEATHHGPTSFGSPVSFIEIGSTPKQWTDPVLGEIAAQATMDAIRLSGTEINTVGFGGTHYSARHTRLNLESQYAVGHLVPKHAFDDGMTASVLNATFQKTTGGCRTALVDWNGLKGSHRRWLLDKLSDWNIEVVRC